MQIYNDYSTIPQGVRVVALGNFDGIHKGHTELLRVATELSHKLGAESCVYTFKQHPSVLSGASAMLITDNSEKTEILSQLDVDCLFFDDFKRVKDLSCEQFCKQVLVDELGCELAVCGENFTFGINKSGDSKLLKKIMTGLGRQCVVCSHIKADDCDSTINSTAIRQAISCGEIEKANKLLGRPYSIFYPVIHGRHLGTKIGIPTVNQAFSVEKLRPKNGVYACICTVGSEKYCGVANVGTKPTVTYGDQYAPILCETHIIGYNGNLYGRRVKIEFYKRLRDEKRFDSLEELKTEVFKNIEQTKKLFANREDIII